MTTAPVLRADLPREALTALIDAAPVRTGPLSQRPDGPRRSLDGAERESLARAGLVTETGASDIGTLIAEVLAAPRSLVTLAVWNDATEGRTTIAFPDTPAGGAGIVANGMEDRFLLAGPVDEADVAPLAEPVIAVLPSEPRTPFEAGLDVEHLVVLATGMVPSGADDDLALFTRKDEDGFSLDDPAGRVVAAGVARRPEDVASSVRDATGAAARALAAARARP